MGDLLALFAWDVVLHCEWCCGPYVSDVVTHWSGMWWLIGVDVVLYCCAMRWLNGGGSTIVAHW